MSTIQDNNGWVYTKICKGVYRLKQAGIIANLELQKYTETFSYHPVRFTAGIWKQETNNTIFALVVDNFGIKCTSESNIEHFLNALRKKYSITVDIKAEKHIGISLKWYYIQCTITH